MIISNRSRPASSASTSRSPNYSAYCLIAAAAFFLLMVTLGSIPGKAEALSAATHDKFLHLSAYFVLGILLFGGLGGSMGRRIAWTLAAVALMGGIDETIQYFLPYRKPELLDWIFNMCAATLSVAAGCAIEKTMQVRRTSSLYGPAASEKTENIN